MKDHKNDRTISPRPEVLNTHSVPHGAPDYEELEAWGFEPEDVLDFSVNGNPYGPPPGVREALQDVPVDRYPDGDALELRAALSEHLHVSPRNIMTGNGAAELIWLIALTFVRPGDRVLVVEPTFGEYARAAALMGAQLETWRARPEANFDVQPADVERHLRRSHPRLTFLCNPNNPTGSTVPMEIIKGWADAHPETLFIVDEAYVSFAPGLRASRSKGGVTAEASPSMSTLKAKNVLTLRSMTKDYALAGLRLGYLIADEGIVDALVRVRPPWNVNAMAQAAGVAALKQQAYVQQCVARLEEAKAQLIEDLKGLALEPLPSATHFFLIPVGDAAALRRALLARGVQVRDCTSFGLPGHIRVATLRPAENAVLLEALREVIA